MLAKVKNFFLTNGSIRQTVFKNTFWLTVGQIVTRALRAIIIIYAARILGANSYGALSYTLSLIGVFSIFSDIGLTTLIAREESRDGPRHPGYLATSLFLKLILVILSMLLVVSIGPLITKIPEAKTLLSLAAFLLAFDSMREFLFALIRARQKMEREVAITIFSHIVLVVLALFVLFISPSSKNLIIAYIISSAVGLISAIFATRKVLLENLPSPAKNREVMKDAWPFALLGILSGVMVSTDILMLGWLKEVYQVGLYGAAQRPLLFLYALPALFAASLLPMFSKYAYADKNRFKKILELSLSFSVAVALPIVIGGFILSKELILFMYGPEFIISAEAFRILLPTLVFVFPSFIIGSAIVSYNAERSLFIFSLLGAAGDIVLNIFLIPKYGILGAAFSTLAAQAWVQIIVWRKLKKINDFSIMGRMYRIIFAAIAMGTLTFILNQYLPSVILTIMISALGYLLILYALKEPLLREIKNIFYDSE